MKRRERAPDRSYRPHVRRLTLELAPAEATLLEQLANGGTYRETFVEGLRALRRERDREGVRRAA